MRKIVLLNLVILFTNCYSRKNSSPGKEINIVSEMTLILMEVQPLIKKDDSTIVTKTRDRVLLFKNHQGELHYTEYLNSQEVIEFIKQPTITLSTYECKDTSLKYFNQTTTIYEVNCSINYRVLNKLSWNEFWQMQNSRPSCVLNYPESYKKISGIMINSIWQK